MRDLGERYSEIEYEEYQTNLSTEVEESSSTYSAYNSKLPPIFLQDKERQDIDIKTESILEEVLRNIDKNYHEDISISILDLDDENCCEYSGFQDSVRRYPASIVKLFWTVMLYGQYQNGLLKRDIDVSIEDEWKAIHKSDNEAASRILDKITLVESVDSLSSESLESWFKKRKVVNSYFEEAGYENINITQKTYPIPYLNMSEPEGSELQIRQATYLYEDQKNTPVRNYLTSLQIIRLLYEISSGEAISNDFSADLKGLMLHDQSPEIWQEVPYNSIEGFFGEYLPDTVRIYTKIGYTQSSGRQEAAIIESQNGDIRYALVVFANNPKFSEFDSKLLPEISKLVYDKMVEAKQN